MRLLFVYDHRFVRSETGEVLSTGSLPAHVWPRYLDHFDNIEVLARDGGQPSAKSGMAKASHPGVQFTLIPNLTTFRQQIIRPRGLKQRIRRSVEACSAALIRLPSELGFLAAAECRRIGKPYAIEVVGCAWDGMFNHGSLLGKLYAPLFFWRARHSIGQAPLALYVTSRWLQGRYPTKGTAFAASDVEIAAMTDAERDHRADRLERIATGSTPQLGTVASLKIRSKGIQTAIAALGALRRKGLELKYRVLGPGDASPWIKLAEAEGVGDLVSFDGVRPAGRGVLEWLDGIDIHLQPSFQEGLPRATIEAMSRGVACIGSTCGGIPELIPTDRLHTPGDVAGLAGRIEALAGNPDALASVAWHDLETAGAFEPAHLAAVRSAFLTELRDRAEVAER